MRLVSNAINDIFYGKIKHISRFSMVGILNTLIDFTVFTIFNELFQVNFIMSQTTGYSFGIANSFIFNKKWTFQDLNSHKKMFREIEQFVVVNLISLGITLIVMNLMVKGMNINVYFSKVVATIIAQITNFLGYKLWVFS